MRGNSGARALRVALAGLILAVGLSGCALRVVDGEAAPTNAPAATEESSRSTPPAPDAEAPDAEAPDAEKTPAASGLSAENQRLRESMAASATTTMPCPRGPLTADATVIRVEGACADLVIEVDAGVVIADDVERLTLSGSGTTVYVQNVAAVTVTGSGSTVLWAGETPQLSDTGSSNTVRRG